MADKKSRSKKAQPDVMLDVGITCTLTEEAPKHEELFEPSSDDSAGEDYDVVPVGWVQIQLIQRVINPEYMAYMQACEEQFSAAFAQAMETATAQGITPTEEQKNDTARVLRLAANAQYHSVLKDTPRYIVVTEDVWVSPPERNKQVAEELDRLTKGLRVDIKSAVADVDGDDE